MYKETFFKRLRDSRTTRIISAFLIINLLVEIISPTMAMALTAGASAPEFSSFEPVATTDMVNDFSGNFTYNLPVLNVPGPDGGGYSMSLAYHSGVSSEEEASWVGLGWTLNPGAINRNKRGYADEFAGVNVENYNKVKANWSHSTKFNCKIELNSSDQKKDQGKGKGVTDILKKIKEKMGLTGMGTTNGSSNDPADISLSLSHTIRYNNYTGFSIANGVGVELFGIAAVDMNRSGGQNTFGFSVNPKMIFKAMRKKTARDSKDMTKKEWDAKNAKEKRTHLAGNTSGRAKGGFLGASYSFQSYEAPAIAYSVARTEGASWNFKGTVKFDPTGPFGLQLGIGGNVNVSASEGKQVDAAYGYMHSDQSNWGGAEHDLYDYQIEKESTFNKHDKNLGIPINNADLFSASGNGVIGGFKIIHDNIGSYYPNTTTSETKIRQLGVELGIGLTNTMGLDFGIGKQKTEVHGKWPKMPTMTNKEFSSGTNHIPKMRFTSDLGGEVNYSDNYDDLLYARIMGNKQLDLNSDYDLALDNAKYHSSSYVDYAQVTSGTNPSIHSLYITNKDGGKSNYTLPVYTKNEAELTIGIPAFQDGTDIVTNPLNYNNPLNNTTVQGHKISAEYASSYLLTSNTTFNYVDADGVAGASDGDFGGWTRFDYKQAYGGAQWYRYRSPYAGLNYNRGRLLDPEDGKGSMSSGDKQVYYLKCIETKSHIAFFVTNKMTAATFTANFPQGQYPYLYNGGLPVASVTTNVAGSGATRYDGVDAAGIDGGTGEDLAANNMAAKGSHDLEKLERIVLFAKSDLSAPMTTTFFEYDYSLCQGIPNSSAPANAPSKDKGKLTLKKVWTESGGVIRSQIAPYEFEYEYFHQYPQEIFAKYPWAKTEFNDVYTTSNDANQNPAYKPSHLDPWGYYQENGKVRFEKMQTWVSQKDPSATFDPAAWQLKRIKLPSGGEIHVNYEQKDYLSVQDLRPTAMVSLLSDDNKDGYSSDESVFCINETDIDVDPGSIATYTNVLKDFFLTQNNKLYYKMLYAFTDDGEPQLNTENRRFEYISGYTAVNQISVSNGKILLHLGDLRDNCLQNGEGKKDKTLPRYVCYQQLLTNGGTNLGLNASYYKSYDYSPSAYKSNPISSTDMSGNAFIQMMPMTIMMFKDWVTLQVKNVPKKKACTTLNFGLSYFKLPVLHAKKGGGIRVKRLLTYDPGISGETGDATLYGSEYIYKNADGTSSGVATNEPSAIHEENVLVSLMERKKQKWLDKIMNGKDTKHYEGPVGESVLPGAEVAHSRIIIKNIHTGKSTTGFAVNTYHTVKEHPMTSDFSRISKDDKTYKKFNLTLPLGQISLELKKAWVTQGYIFKLNDMHGKIAGKATYPGNYDPTKFSESGFTSKTTYNYSQLGEKILTMLFDNSTKEFKRDHLNPGMEEDYTMFTSQVRDKTCNFSVEADFNLTSPILPSLGFTPGFGFTDIMLCQHLTSKVVRQVSYLLSTTNITDGIAQTTENLAFDRYTGDPVLTRTFDGYMAPNQSIYTQAGGSTKHSGYYYALNIPASWMYSSLRPKSVNSANTNQLTQIAGNVVTYGTNELYTALSNTSISAWSPTTTLSNVVNATATTYTNNWFLPTAANEYTALGNTTIRNTANTFFYPERSFSYKDAVSDANLSGGKIYKDGLMVNSFKFFDWVAYTPSTTVSQEWYSDSRITKYSPFGYPVEEEDVLAIKSSARFGYSNTLPVLVAQNAGYDDTRFTDFEYGLGGNSKVTTSSAHSGRSSYLWSADQGYVVAANYPIHTHKGLSIKVWLKSMLSSNINDVNYKLKNPNPQFKAQINNKTFDFKSIAQTGEWTLYSAEITNFQGLSSATYSITFSYNTAGTELVYIDDVRLQPLDASMNCSVYYADNKLAAQFDDQHFGVFYEYNGKGQLVRKSIETERGKKTLQEQQYNTPLKTKTN